MEQTPDNSRDALPVAPSLGPTLESVAAPMEAPPPARRTAWLSALAILIGLSAGVIAEVLMRLIALITNLVFFHRVSFAMADPGTAHVGLLVLVIPILGAIVIGFMARFGSIAIRGHGIPEVMEKVLYGGSRIPARLMFLKPASAAIAIGTGGPFGAEGPIIATGGALGSVVGQLLRITADERKTLLAAGAAAGMSATFGSPVSAVLLAVELLLFEFRPRSLIPVALASCAAMVVRLLLISTEPAFRMTPFSEPGALALVIYVVIGALLGLAAVLVTRAVYAIEDGFERLPVHWMWWPAIGAVAVGVAALLDPRILGVGYGHIEDILNARVLGVSLAMLVLLKFAAWSIYLGSGTSGGTLAPLFIIGGGLGALLGTAFVALLPHAHINPGIAALVGMAAMFAGASHALLASVVFAFETTRQPLGLLPLLGGCSAAYLISLAFMRHSIMTEKLARRGTPVSTEYSVDFMSQVQVSDVLVPGPITLNGAQRVADVREWLRRKDAPQHQGFPVLDDRGELIGVVTRRDVLAAELPVDTTVAQQIRRAPLVVFPDSTLREAADQMVRGSVGRLPVVERSNPRKLVGIVTRSDLLGAHARRIENAVSA